MDLTTENQPMSARDLMDANLEFARGSLELLSTVALETKSRPLTPVHSSPETAQSFAFSPPQASEPLTPLTPVPTPPSVGPLTPLTQDIVHGIMQENVESNNAISLAQFSSYEKTSSSTSCFTGNGEETAHHVTPPAESSPSNPTAEGTSVTPSTGSTPGAETAIGYILPPNAGSGSAEGNIIPAEGDKRESSSTSSSDKPYDLPPCRVCGDKGTGFHYGVNTCEACKGFFRRSLLRKEQYRCKGNQHCQLRPNRRRMCPYCRLEKCHAVGMSKDGIKTGRYSAEKKLTDIYAVKQLKAERALAAIEEDGVKRGSEIEQLVTTIVEARRRNFRDWDVYDKELAEMQQMFMIRWQQEGYSVQGMTIADMFMKLKSNEQVEMFNRILLGIEDAVRKEIKFAKAIPGFKELTMEDQVALCKVALGDIRVLDRYKWFDQESRRVTTDRTSAILDIVPIFGEKFADVAFKAAKRLCDMNLSEAEDSVLIAVALFGTDRCDLVSPVKVQAIHDRLVEALHWLLRKNHPDETLIFPRLVAVLTELRPLQDFAKASLNDVLTSKMDSDVLQVPPVFWEMVSPS